MPSPAEDSVLHQAAHWYVQLGAEDHSAQDQAAWQAWCDSDPRHADAWRKVEALQARLRPVPQGLGRVLLSPPRSRRRVLSGLSMVLLGLGAWTVTSTQTDWLVPQFSYSTLPGERRTITLADGSRLLLNTHTRVLVRYGPQRRTVRLERGELELRTAPDTQQPARPLVVETVHGQMHALGTRFAVRLDVSSTRVAVQEHAVLVQPASGTTTQRVEAAQAVRFTAQGAGPLEVSGFEDTAWVGGQLIVLQQPLGLFAQELSRYRQQPVLVDPSVAHLLVSGSYALGEPDRSLRAAVAQLPVRLLVQGQQIVRILPM